MYVKASVSPKFDTTPKHENVPTLISAINEAKKLYKNGDSLDVVKTKLAKIAEEERYTEAQINDLKSRSDKDDVASALAGFRIDAIKAKNAKIKKNR